MDWARTARSERERAIFLQMAETSLQAAALLESRDSASSRNIPLWNNPVETCAVRGDA